MNPETRGRKQTNEFHYTSGGVPGSICGVNTKFHESAIGTKWEYFDDHQRWVIKSYDAL